MSVTAGVAGFVHGTCFESLPPDIVALARRGLIDGVAVMLAGRSEEATALVQRYVATLGEGPCTVVGTAQRATPAAAALANGVSAHAHDFDDTQVSSSPDRIYGLMTHPTASVLAASLAAAELVDASGTELLNAYLVGIEVACKICDAIWPFHYIRGFHTTATMGVFGATAAAAKLLALEPTEICHALGIAASASAGLRVNFGTMTKPLHAGRAAEAGVVAAQLAKSGFTARADALDNAGGYFKVMGGDFRRDDPSLTKNPLWGYVDVDSAGFDPDRILGKLGRPFVFETPGISIKPYPSVVLSHPSMTALLDLLRANDLPAQAIEKIRVHAGPNVLNILYREPKTGTEGKFSLTFCLACISLRRRATLADFTDEFVTSAEARDMTARVELVRDAAIESQGFATIDSRIEVLLKDGRTLEAKSGPYKGGPQNPLTEAELDAKFLDCAAMALPKPSADQALAGCKEIETISTRELMGKLRG
jgi:2-methylcitrate dehydratase PrpD